MNKNIEIGEIFNVSKTQDKFVEVIFRYSKEIIWSGCLPIYYSPMSIDLDVKEIEELSNHAYDELSPKKINKNILETKKRWSKSNTSETYKVFNSLLSAQWECRTCGAGKINNQPAARIRDIKKNGFIIATKNKYCIKCKKQQYHDILLVFEVISKTKAEFRKPIPNLTKKKIFSQLSKKDVFFNSIRPENEFIIDHKFPSQRWTKPESDNVNLSPEEIRNKFQLLTNQTNMLKSRACDECFKTAIRPSFLGIDWFYSGDKDWKPNSNIGSGCYGCPWFDLEKWKKEINKLLAIKKPL